MQNTTERGLCRGISWKACLAASALFEAFLEKGMLKLAFHQACLASLHGYRFLGAACASPAKVCCPMMSYHCHHFQTKHWFDDYYIS